MASSSSKSQHSVGLTKCLQLGAFLCIRNSCERETKVGSRAPEIYQHRRNVSKAVNVHDEDSQARPRHLERARYPTAARNQKKSPWNHISELSKHDKKPMSFSGL
jgi:hypothetical protein